jgi:endonuclease/exonuclease/phosphatase (EEP) superfamily protein YafD
MFKFWLKNLFRLIAIAAIGGLLTVSLGSYFAWRYPWELLTHFRVQYFLLSLGLVLGLFGLWRSRYLIHPSWLLIGCVLLGLNAAEIVPWYLPHPQQMYVADRASGSQDADAGSGLPFDRDLRVLSVNVNSSNKAYAPTIEMVQTEQPDVVLFIEMNPQWIEQLKVSLSDRLPYNFDPVGDLFVMSRLPLQDVRVEQFNTRGSFLLATLKLADQTVQWVGVHPRVPLREQNFHQRNQQLDELSQYLSTIKTPVIAIGDFNITPWSPYYRQFIQQASLHNAQLGRGIFPSFPRASTLVPLPKWLIPIVNVPIDHCFVSPHFGVREIHTVTHGNADHAALSVGLVLLKGE